ncbi:MAG: immune inhibitor A [Acidimicrobiia bacterium]|nr:immune inhibitor A [Acidimicrobiia bacterium]
MLAVLVATALIAAACTRDRTDAQPVTTPALATPVESTSTVPEPLDDPNGLDRRIVPAFDAIDWYVRSGLIAPDEAAIDAREIAAVGDVVVFNVSDEGGTAEVPAKLVYLTDEAALWVEEGVDFDQAEFQSAATVLTEEIIPAVTATFGPLPSPGIDGDGRVDVLHLASLGSSAGEFGAGDLLPVAIAPASNERELLYVNLEATTIGSDFYFATLAHEVQHLIDAGIRPNTPLWLSEGLAQLAERLAGYDAVGTDTEFLSTRPVQLNSWGPLQLDSRHYGAAYLFSLYIWEQFGDEIAAAIASSPYDGLSAVDTALAGAGTTVEAVFADWIVANYLDRPDLDSRYGYAHDTLRPVCPVDRVEALPHTIIDDVDQFAARYHVIEGSGEVTIRFLGSDTTGPIPDLPHRGLYMWWSGRSDNSATSLTRSFDLSGVTRATLEFRIWHDTGLGDAAVVSASTDGGESWSPLAGRQSSAAGGALPVPSYNGTSGKGDSAVWVGDSIDLTPYAGGEVLIRFEYITDLFENRAGMALDEIEIPEIGYVDGAEDESDWVTNGFIRMPGTLAQPWTVRVVDTAADPVVTDVPIKEGSGSYAHTLTPGSPTIVVVSPIAVATAVPATYQLDVGGGALVEATTGSIDEFRDPCAGWELENEASYTLRYDTDRLAIDLHEDQVFTWSARDGYHEDVRVTATSVFGPGAGVEGAVGIMCRVSNAGFYDFEVSSDGYVFGGLALGDDYEVLRDWEESDVVNTGDGALNIMTLDCTGDRIRFDVNGTTVIDVTDDQLVGGEIALSASSFDGSGFSMFYETVEVTGQDPTGVPGLVSFADFESDEGSWTLEESSRGVLEVKDGRYLATVRPADWGVEGYAGIDVNDVVVDLDVTVLEDSPDGSITLSCRNQPDGDQYLFLFGLDGFVTASALIDGEFQGLTDWELTSQLSAVVGDVNHLRLRCVGSELELAANGVVIAQASDERLTGGDVGVGMFTFEHGNYVVAFDNILIRRSE